MVKDVAGLCCWTLAAATAFAAEGDRPQVRGIGAIAADTVTVKIASQRIERGRQIAYEQQPGDVVDGGIHRFVRRNGKLIGALAGAEGKIIFTTDQVVGEPLDMEWAMRPESYRVLSPDDARFGAGLAPTKVQRKSRVSQFARTSEPQGAATEHTFYLHLPHVLEPSRRYMIEFVEGSIDRPSAEFVYDVRTMPSEAVHVSQVGFRPDDPAKVAYLSCWISDAGGVAFQEGLNFTLVDQASGNAVFRGTAQLAKRADEKEPNGKRNVAQADIHRMDFSSFATPGTYRVSVDGVGCSLPFPISQDAWTSAFYQSVRGLYHQRSGIELGPPHTEFVRPRGFHPDDGVKVYHSNFAVGEANRGEGGVFKRLLEGKTDEIVPNAWGGYMDAADWDRRPLHIEVPRLMLDLYDLRPDAFDRLNLNIPESHDALPDLLNEALWVVDFHKRMQTPEGGIRPGIESSEHPRRGEGSWQESLTIMAYAPGPRISFRYAGVAAHAAHILERKDAKHAEEYRRSAMRAFEWAEKQTDKSDPTMSERALAAAELFRLTGEQRFHDIFLSHTKFRNAEAIYEGAKIRAANYSSGDAAGWVYLRTDRPGMNQAVKQNVRTALIASADRDITAMARSSFDMIPTPFRFVPYGTTANPDAITVVRAHHLTGDPKYLRAAILACQHGAGANALNLSYTTCVGANPVRNPIHEDAYVSSQSVPPGLTVFGPIAPESPVPGGHRGTEKRIHNALFPAAEKWPADECYFDLNQHPPMTEFTVFATIAPNAYVWGYLGAR